MSRRILSIAAILVMTFLWLAQAGAAEEWQVTGLGGAGGMYTPTISPYDSSLMFLSCDMSGSYRSVDGGKSWQLIHYMQIRSTLGCRPAFTKDLVFWAEESTLKCSSDKGLTWKAVPVGGTAPWTDNITAIAAVDGDPAGVAVGTGSGVWTGGMGADGKAAGNWVQMAEGRCGGIAAVGPEIFAAVTGKDNKGARVIHWQKGQAKPLEELPVPAAGGNPVTALAAGSAGENSPVCLYATVEKVGIVKSADGGKTWSVADKWQEQGDVLVPQGQTDVAYAAQEGGHDVWRTADGGKRWQSIFHMTGADKNVDVAWTQTFLHWDYSISHLGLGIDPRDPNVVMMTSEGDFYRSNDGGKSWFQCQNDPVGVKPGDPAFRFRCIGLEVTTLWGYYFDPNDPNRHYIAYTDVGFARSVDKGETWISAVEGCPWSNTLYQLAFDPYVKGRIYAACSSRHDIPHWTHIDANRGQKGGVCVSDDYGATWKVLGTGLPALPCTSIAVDPKSPKDKLTLYATLYEGGLYKSTDGGATWEKKSNGLGNPGNMHAIRIRIHPKSGNLYCMITAFRKEMEFAVPGGLWVSSDGGETWKDLTASHKFPRPTDFAVLPDDENTIYINASTIPGANIGGIFKTIDGGKEWKQLLTDEDFGKWCSPSFYEGSTLNLHPDDPNIVYVGTESHGLWYTTDAGKSWKVYESFPFGSPQNVAFDPADHKRIVVTTFGAGAWKGPYLPEAK
jgi:photosystem II stability/assembly factor-like uncharacterized protein